MRAKLKVIHRLWVTFKWVAKSVYAGYMEHINLETEYALSAHPVPQIVERKIHHGLTYRYPENFPQWELFRHRMLALARRTAKRTKSSFCFGGLIACLAYDIPTCDYPLKLEMHFTDGKRRSNSKVGVMGKRGGVPVQRFMARIPAEAIYYCDDIPVLAPQYLLLNLLSAPSLRESLGSADALVKNLFDIKRKLTMQQQSDVCDFYQEVSRVATDYLSQSLTHRALKRLELVNPLAESLLESIVRADLVSLGFENLVLQREIVTEGGVFYADIYIPDLHLVVECDGAAKYAMDPNQVAEVERQRCIEAKGFVVRRVSWEASKEPGGVMRALGLRPR